MFNGPNVKHLVKYTFEFTFTNYLLTESDYMALFIAKINTTGTNFYTGISACFNFVKMPTTATYHHTLCRFLLFRIIKYTIWMFFVEIFFKWFILGFWV